ncbi:MAG: ArnT family glycosyltransferase [Opitutales bacterium]
MDRPWRDTWIWWLPVLAGVTLGAWGGVPVTHPDETTRLALGLLLGGGLGEFYNYPALVLWLHAAALWVSSLVTDSPEALFTLSRSLAHGINLAFTALGIVATTGIARSLGLDRRPAGLAGLFLATAPLWAVDSHFLTVDIPAAALTTATLGYALAHLRRPVAAGWLPAVVLGGLVGLAGAAKYPGALVAVAVLPALWRGAGGTRAGVARLGLGGLTALAVFLAINPGFLIEPGQAWHGLAAEWQHSRAGHPGYGTRPALLDVLTRALPFGLNPLLAGAGLGGCLFLMVDRKLTRAARWATLAYPVLVLLLVGQSALAFDRYLLPVLPVLAIGAARLVERGLAAPVAIRRHRLLAALTGVVLLANAGTVAWHNRLMGRTDTRQLLGELWRDDAIRTAVTTLAVTDYVYDPVHRQVPTVRLFEEAGPVTAPVAVLDGFTLDRLAAWDRPMPWAWGRLAAGEVLTLSPYRTAREAVRVSPKSNYSPYPPDLFVRTRPGPYIELYVAETAVADQLAARLARLGVRTDRAPAPSGWFFRQLPVNQVASPPLTSNLRACLKTPAGSRERLVVFPINHVRDVTAFPDSFRPHARSAACYSRCAR